MELLKQLHICLQAVAVVVLSEQSQVLQVLVDLVVVRAVTVQQEQLLLQLVVLQEQLLLPQLVVLVQLIRLLLLVDMLNMVVEQVVDIPRFRLTLLLEPLFGAVVEAEMVVELQLPQCKLQLQVAILVEHLDLAAAEQLVHLALAPLQELKEQVVILQLLDLVVVVEDLVRVLQLQD